MTSSHALFTRRRPPRPPGRPDRPPITADLLLQSPLGRDEALLTLKQVITKSLFNLNNEKDSYRIGYCHHQLHSMRSCLPQNWFQMAALDICQPPYQLAEIRDQPKGLSADRPCPISWPFCRNILAVSGTAQAFLFLFRLICS